MEVVTAEQPKNVLSVMNHTGDSKFMWDSKNEVETAAAKEQFDALKKKGYIAFTVDKKGNQGDIIHKFDPTLEKIIMTPPIVGG